MKHYSFFTSHYSLLFLFLLLFSSCATRQKMIYLQDMDETVNNPVSQKYELKIQRDEKLQIIVSSKDPELSLAFNLPGVGGYSVAADGAIDVNNTTNNKNQGYIVDVNGDIDFPILGKLHVEGLTRGQVTNLIKDQLEQRELLKNPLVQVDIMNFSFSVLGEVNRVGRYTLDGDRITILEAIAMAGDLKTGTSRIDRVAVIREFGGNRRIIHVDLRSKDIFLSPAYYLQQNDIVYVEPNGRRAQEQDERRLRFWMYGVSSVTTILSLVLLLTKL